MLIYTSVRGMPGLDTKGEGTRIKREHWSFYFPVLLRI